MSDRASRHGNEFSQRKKDISRLVVFVFCSGLRGLVKVPAFFLWESIVE